MHPSVFCLTRAYIKQENKNCRSFKAENQKTFTNLEKFPFYTQHNRSNEDKIEPKENPFFFQDVRVPMKLIRSWLDSFIDEN